MSIQKWHVGKLIILWAWGGGGAVLALSDFMSRSVGSAPLLHLIEIVSVVLVFLLLSCLTWHWLSGREKTDTAPGQPHSKEEARET
jgi:hypothetical protein